MNFFTAKDLGGCGLYHAIHEISFCENEFHDNSRNIRPSKITRYTVNNIIMNLVVELNKILSSWYQMKVDTVLILFQCYVIVMYIDPYIGIESHSLTCIYRECHSCFQGCDIARNAAVDDEKLARMDP